MNSRRPFSEGPATLPASAEHDHAIAGYSVDALTGAFHSLTRQRVRRPFTDEQWWVIYRRAAIARQLLKIHRTLV